MYKLIIFLFVLYSIPVFSQNDIINYTDVPINAPWNLEFGQDILKVYKNMAAKYGKEDVKLNFDEINLYNKEFAGNQYYFITLSFFHEKLYSVEFQDYYFLDKYKNALSKFNMLKRNISSKYGQYNSLPQTNEDNEEMHIYWTYYSGAQINDIRLSIYKSTGKNGEDYYYLVLKYIDFNRHEEKRNYNVDEY